MALTAFPRNISTKNQFESSSNWILLRQPQRRALQETHTPSKANADFKTLLIYKPFLKSIHKTNPHVSTVDNSVWFIDTRLKGVGGESKSKKKGMGRTINFFYINV